MIDIFPQNSISYLFYICHPLLLLFLDTGWRFHRDGKAFYCDECRKMPTWIAKKRCDRISLEYFLVKNEREPPICDLCQITENEVHGELLAFLNEERKMCCVHLNCVKYSTILKPAEAQNSRMAHDYQNVFDIIKGSKLCSVCKNRGASIRCSTANCSQVFHYHCAMTECEWDFRRKGTKRFQCENHQKDIKFKPLERNTITAKKVVDEGNESSGRLAFQHDLLSTFGGTTKISTEENPENLDITDVVLSCQQQNSLHGIVNDMNRYESSDDDDSFVLWEDSPSFKVMDLQLSCNVSGPIQLVHLQRCSREDFWNISFQLIRLDNSFVVTVAKINVSEKEKAHNDEQLVSLQAKDIILSINGSKVGFDGLETLRGILQRLDKEVSLIIGVIRQDCD